MSPVFRYCHKCGKWTSHVEKRSGFSCSFCKNIIKWNKDIFFKMVDKDDDYKGFNIKLKRKFLKQNNKKDTKIDICDFHKPSLV